MLTRAFYCVLVLVVRVYSFQRFGKLHNPLRHVALRQHAITSRKPDSITDDLKVLSFNIWAPCYKKIASEVDGIRRYESDEEVTYLHRNAAICDKLAESDADIMCIQEFWSANAALRKLYEEKLCGPNGKYSPYYINRTSHWRARKDGLAIFVNKNRIQVEDVKHIYFHDCGDRVALCLLCAYTPPPPPSSSSSMTLTSVKKQYFLVVNTHLLFPHNEYSSRIRLREAAKILGYVYAYQQSVCVNDQCKDDGMGAVHGEQRASGQQTRLPVILAGDFNGSPNGGVYRYLLSQNFQPSLLEDEGHPGGGGKVITHRNHRGDEVNVDQIFVLNPSSPNVNPDASAASSPPAPLDWTSMVCQELAEKVMSEYRKAGGRGLLGGKDLKEMFGIFDADRSEFITKEEFVSTLRRLGFEGEDGPALIEEEVQAILDSTDTNKDGLIDFQEFCDRFFWPLLHPPGAPASQAAPLPVLPLPTPAPRDPDTLLYSQDSVRSDPSLYLPTDQFSFSWLGGDAASSDSSSNNSSSENSQQTQQVRVAAEECMAGLQVRGAELYPAALHEGRWPADYALSDHGIFTAYLRVLTSEERQ